MILHGNVGQIFFFFYKCGANIFFSSFFSMFLSLQLWRQVIVGLDCSCTLPKKYYWVILESRMTQYNFFAWRHTCSILLVASRHNGYNLEIPFIFEGCLHADVLFTGLEYNYRTRATITRSWILSIQKTKGHSKYINELQKVGKKYTNRGF